MDNRGAFDDPLREPGFPSVTPIRTRRRVPLERYVSLGALALVLLLVFGIDYIGPTEAVAGVAQAEAPRPVVALATNPLLTYSASLATSTCKLPKFGRELERLRAYLTAELSCLDAAWKPLVTALNMPFEPTKLVMDKSSGECRSRDDSAPVAFYCGADNQLHMPIDTVLQGTDGIPAVIVGVLAHEYGHHVQDISGILLAESRREQSAGRDTDAGLELSRRLELQANCFAGMFLASVAGRGSISRSMAADGAAAFADGGGEKDHGSAAHQGRWAEIGYQENKTAACNTWAAAQGDVS
ncbi:neutral zinc metallopeptidase [Kutzneria sp. CA-103260]|uniref:neutral zinc metallopeptidase n=1 Tax=Kutzneria sp. CA-103260 TaxID=2802641 RepID=UPI001BA5FAB6|nr:neutral zinc metallopeptidase [Kutzneria sp. CA-103260]QUQ68986.1 Putative neutral zinc metallopeptidase [Kutzneria sp. CA-103260]